MNKYNYYFVMVLVFLAISIGLVSAITWSPQGNISLKNRYYILNDPISDCALNTVVNGKFDNGTWSCVSAVGNSSWNESWANNLYLLLDSSNDPITSDLEIRKSLGNTVNFTIGIDSDNGILQYIKSVDSFYLRDVTTLVDLFVSLGNITSYGTLNMNDNPIILDGITLKPLDEKNSQISGPAYGVYMTGPSGQNLPHWILQSGGSSQASVLLRSQMIVNEIAGFHNTTNATDCISYMDEVSETLKIDCNTTTTGADLLVGDDMQVVGDVWIKDSDGDWHFMTRTLNELDRLYDDILFNRINYSLSGTNLTILDYIGETFVVNINNKESILSKNEDSVLITAGTNSSPQMNYIQYINESSPTMDSSTSELSEEFADIGQVLLGSAGNIYGSIIGSATNYEFIRKVYLRFFDDGTVYKSGFAQTFTATTLNIGTGSFKILLDEVSTSNNLTLSDEFFFIKSNGTYVQTSLISDISEYSDGTTISAGKEYNIVWGIIQNGDNEARLMAVIQDYPGAGKEYGKPKDAEIDKYQKTNYYPSNDFLKKLFVPIARTIVSESDDQFKTFENGQYYLDIRGSNSGQGGSAPSPSITLHSDLGNLDYASSGHTGFVGTSTNAVLTTLDTGQGANELYDMDQNVLTTSAVSFSTIDTGQGSNELYDMDQNVLTTSNVQYNNITSIDCIVFDSGGKICSGV